MAAPEMQLGEVCSGDLEFLGYVPDLLEAPSDELSSGEQVSTAYRQLGALAHYGVSVSSAGGFTDSLRLGLLEALSVGGDIEPVLDSRGLSGAISRTAVITSLAKWLRETAQARSEAEAARDRAGAKPAARQQRQSNSPATPKSADPGRSAGNPGEGDKNWRDRAACKDEDPEIFSPKPGETSKNAKRICGGCAVRAACLEHAQAKDERFGIWGGLTERERRGLKKGSHAA